MYVISTPSPPPSPLSSRESLDVQNNESRASFKNRAMASTTSSHFIDSEYQNQRWHKDSGTDG